MTPLVLVSLLLLVVGPAWAQPPMAPSQPGNTLNQEVTGAVGAATVVTLVAPGTTRAHLVSLDARCSSGPAQVTITNGAAGPILWSSPPMIVGTLTLTRQWSPPLAGSFGTNLVVTLSPCGGQNASGTLDIHGHVF